MFYLAIYIYSCVHSKPLQSTWKPQKHALFPMLCCKTRYHSSHPGSLPSAPNCKWSVHPLHVQILEFETQSRKFSPNFLTTLPFLAKV